MVITKDKIYNLLQDIKDPEIPHISIIELGMINDVEISDDSINIDIIDLKVDAGNDTLICYGTTAQLIVDTTVVPGIMPYTYSWSSSDSLNDPNIYNPIASNRDTIKYTVTVTDMIGCVTTDFVTIEVNPRLLIDAGAGGFICYMDSIQLSASVDLNNIGTPPYNYQWTGSGLLTDYISNDTITDPFVRPLDTTKYVIVVTDSNQCTANDSLFIDVNPEDALEKTNN